MRNFRSLVFAGIVAAAMLPACANGGDLIYTGNLQRVTPESLTVRLADGSLVDARLPKKGDLTGAALAATYKLADQVQIRCKDNLELKQVRYLGPASPAEREPVFAASSWHEGDNLLQHPEPGRVAHDPEGEGLAPFERAREVNLRRAESLPSFTADENVKRYLVKKGKESRLVDTIDAEVTFKNGEPDRENIRVNGKPSKRISGIQWSVDFGTELKPLFRPACPNTFRFDGRQAIGGRQVLAYMISAPPGSCFGYAADGRRRYIPARTGRILVDEATGYLVQYEEESIAFPKDFPVVSVNALTRWDDVRIGDATHLLPVTYEFLVEFANGDQWRIAGEFHNHRQFQASTNITFQQ